MSLKYKTYGFAYFARILGFILIKLGLKLENLLFFLNQTLNEAMEILLEEGYYLIS